jgi:hypothetical protein
MRPWEEMWAKQKVKLKAKTMEGRKVGKKAASSDCSWARTRAAQREEGLCSWVDAMGAAE